MICRFVIQEHTTPEGVHWDFMLEQEGVLTTFRLEKTPAQCLAGEVRAVKIFDHPLRFLTYEGPVQKGTGKVKIVDSGEYRFHDRQDDLLTFELNGKILKGDFALNRIEGDEWRFAAQGVKE
ncbi:MAG: DNA polymerase ligase N-terminal domain-containing protein [Solirubrobacterales bacterium]